MNRSIHFAKRIFYTFLKGLIFSGPVLLTIYVFIVLFDWVDRLIPIEKFLPPQITYIPGFGLLFIFIIFFLIGYFSRYFVFDKLFKTFTNQFIKIPFLSFLFSSIKDLFDVFNKKDSKLNKPILFKMSESEDVYQIGFLVKDNLKKLGLDDYVCIYVPFSFGFMGKTYLIKRTQLGKEISKDVHSSQVLKFIISGGISGLSEDTENGNTENKTDL